MKRLLAILMSLFIVVGFGLTSCKTGPKDDSGTTEEPTMVTYKCAKDGCPKPTKTGELGATAGARRGCGRA